MTTITSHTSLTLDQEIDTVVICPDHSDYIIVGTYSLVKPSQPDPGSLIDEDQVDDDNNDDAQETKSQQRIGSLQLLKLSNTTRHYSDPDIPPQPLIRIDLPCAILDLRFCPADSTLLVAATSIGELRFFRVDGPSEVSENNDGVGSVRIIPLGIAKVSTTEDHDKVPTPLITHVAWLDERRPIRGTVEASEREIHRLAVCDTTGRTNLIQVSLPTSTAAVQGTNSDETRDLQTTIEQVHKHLHDLEAWTVHPITTSSDSNATRQVVLSGGDDSCLVASSYTISHEGTGSIGEALESPPVRVFVDKRNHTAGVVAILSLPPVRIAGGEGEGEGESDTGVPVLTGSYDQRLRLFMLDRDTLRPTLAAEVELEGGVWRVALLESYTKRGKGDGSRSQQHYILLVSAMHAGCYIVRLVYRSPEADNGSGSWEWRVEARFLQPHESMVYACAARVVQTGQDNVTTWQVVSTSFYDKRLCVWRWEDRVYGC